MNNRYKADFGEIPVKDCSDALGYLAYSLMWCDTHEEQLTKRDNELLEAVYFDVCLIFSGLPDIAFLLNISDQDYDGLNKEEEESFQELAGLHMNMIGIRTFLFDMTEPSFDEYDTIQLIAKQSEAQHRIKKVVEQLALETSKHEPKNRPPENNQ